VSLHGLPTCAIGIAVDSTRCARCNFQHENLTKLRRSIWQFVLTKVQQIPPHIKDFLEAEQQSEAIELKNMSTLQDPYRNTSAKQKLAANTLVTAIFFLQDFSIYFQFNLNLSSYCTNSYFLPLEFA